MVFRYWKTLTLIYNCFCFLLFTIARNIHTNFILAKLPGARTRDNRGDNYPENHCAC